MEKRLHQLETFPVRGEDGKSYVVHGYEHLAKLEGGAAIPDQWEPTGIAEYKLATGEPVVMSRDGAMRVASSGMKLVPESGGRASAQLK
jgi:hypothetical protein